MLEHKFKNSVKIHWVLVVPPFDEFSPVMCEASFLLGVLSGTASALFFVVVTDPLGDGGDCCYSCLVKGKMEDLRPETCKSVP